MASRLLALAVSLPCVAGMPEYVAVKLAQLQSADVVFDAQAKFLTAAPAASTPQQLHLSLTGNPTEMAVSWVLLSDDNLPCVSAAASLYPGVPPSTGAASTGTLIPTIFSSTWATYEAGFGWNGTIYTAIMTGLTPSSPYYYTVSGCGPIISNITTFTAAPIPSPSVNTLIAVTADMGTVVPLGFAVAAQITKDHEAEPFDMATISGDLSYATVDPPHNEFETVWDAWGNLIQPYASTAPYLAGVGNHEHTPGTLMNTSGSFSVDYAAYQARFAAGNPSNGNSNLWFSVDRGNIHFSLIDSEEDLSPSSPQHNWLAADLAAALANRAVVPWLMVMMHRPVYCSTTSESGDHTPGGKFPTAIEGLLIQYKVDVMLTGHEHLYERTNALAANGAVITTATGSNNTYVSPGGPIYVVQGTAGAFVGGDWIKPTPAWSAFKNAEDYGYGKMRVTGDSHLTYDFIDTNGKVIDHWEITK